MKERLRLRKLRAAKKPQNSDKSSSATPYRSSQSLGKAVKRARTKSSQKQRCVVSKLAESVGLKVVGPLTQSTPPHAHGSALSDDTKRLVHDFYQNISWQAPGCKDRVIIRESTEGREKVKRTEHVRFMLMSLREAHSKFKEEHPSLKIGVL